ncbi:MAG: FliA/WhiG family RNA polymerase sigma factor [Deferribacterales bacterium]|nr:FliA/WhiG family RNA polymerase sigma factor [Deferribacterales bacterium]
MLGTATLTHFTEEEKNAVVAEFLPKIKSWTIRLKGMLPANVEVDDLYSAASLGLIESLERFDKTRNIAFNTFAERRIKGAIMDSLRNLDFLPRNVRSRLKSLEDAVSELAVTLGRQPSFDEIVKNTDFDEDDVLRLQSLKDNDKVLSLDEKAGEGETTLMELISGGSISPEDEVLKTKLITRIGEEIDKLSDSERQLISLYYYEELTMKEVAQVLGVTESRVCQKHGDIMQKLKRRLKDLYD